MDIAILICCIAILILLLLQWLRPPATNDTALQGLEQQLTLLRENLDRLERQLTEQEARRNEYSTRQMTALDKSIREALERNQTRTDASLEKLRQDMTALREQNDRQLTALNTVVAEKMPEILDRKFHESFTAVTNQMTTLGKTLRDGQERQQAANTEQLTALRESFAAIRKDLTDALEKVRSDNTAALDKLRTENQASLDKIDQTVNEKLQKTLNDRITQSFEAVNKRLTEVYEGLGEMKNVASGVSDLKKVLSNVKNRGIMGEIQLSAILGDILAPEQYETQYRLCPEKDQIVDFAVKLPGTSEGQWVYLPIDSKFPGDRYADLMDAYETGDAGEVRAKRAALEQEIKRCAKSIHDKYIVPPYSTDFAILFLPFEGLYAEVVNMGLVEVLQREYRVNLTGPSTMAAMLNSLQMGFRTLAIQKKSGEVWKILEAAKDEFGKFEQVLNKTRERLRQADDELEKLVGTRTNAINRKLRDVSSLDNGETASSLLQLPS